MNVYIQYTIANRYLVCERSDVIFEAEGSRFLVKFRMIDGRLVDMPEELVDALLLDQICLVGGVSGRLRGIGQVCRSQEQRNRFHPRACFAKDRPMLFVNCFIYSLSADTKVRSARLGDPWGNQHTDNDQSFLSLFV